MSRYDWRISKPFLSLAFIYFIIWMGWNLGNLTCLSLWRRLEYVEWTLLLGIRSLTSGIHQLLWELLSFPLTAMADSHHGGSQLTLLWREGISEWKRAMSILLVPFWALTVSWLVRWDKALNLCVSKRKWWILSHLHCLLTDGSCKRLTTLFPSFLWP